MVERKSVGKSLVCLKIMEKSLVFYLVGDVKGFFLRPYINIFFFKNQDLSRHLAYA